MLEGLPVFLVKEDMMSFQTLEIRQKKKAGEGMSNGRHVHVHTVRRSSGKVTRNRCQLTVTSEVENQTPSISSHAGRFRRDIYMAANTVSAGNRMRTTAVNLEGWKVQDFLSGDPDQLRI
jgi:hypothetical protein